MPQKPTVDQGPAQTQAGRRFLDTFHDNHASARFRLGRPFCGYLEYAANPELGHQPGFVSADLSQGNHAEPLTSIWTAPWIPEARYFRFDYLRKKITFAYETMERDEQAAIDRHYEAAAKLSGESGWAEVEYGQPLSYQIRSIIGRAPKMLRIAQAARAGDPWLLGHIDEPNDELAQILNFKVIRVGGMERARAIGTPVVGSVPQPAAPLTVEQVLAAAAPDLAKMVAAIVAQTMAAERGTRTQAARDARAANRKKSPQAETMTA